MHATVWETTKLEQSTTEFFTFRRFYIGESALETKILVE